MTKLVRDYISRDVREVHGRDAGPADADNPFAILVERAGERHELGLGEENRDVAWQVTQGGRKVGGPATAAENRAAELL